MNRSKAVSHLGRSLLYNHNICIKANVYKVRSTTWEPGVLLRMPYVILSVTTKRHYTSLFFSKEWTLAALMSSATQHSWDLRANSESLWITTLLLKKVQVFGYRSRSSCYFWKRPTRNWVFQDYNNHLKAMYGQTLSQLHLSVRTAPCNKLCFGLR